LENEKESASKEKYFEEENNAGSSENDQEVEQAKCSSFNEGNMSTQKVF